MSRTTRMGLGSALVFALVGAAHGQDAPSRTDEKRPPLQGPKVQQNRPPHVEDDFGEGMKPGKEGRREPMIPMRAYSEVIDKLRGDKAPEGLRLSEQQEHQIGAIEQEFRDSAKEFAQKMRQERGGQGQPSDAKPGDAKPERRRELAQEMAKNGPRPGDYQTRIWAALNQKQQGFVKTELDQVREELQKKRGEEMMQRRLNEKGKGSPDQPAARPGLGQGPDVAPAVRERAQRIMRRMAQLPPEDRDRILKRLEEELDRRGIPDSPPGDSKPPLPPQPPKDRP